MTENEIGKIVVNAGYIVHQRIGVGLLESAYKECLFYELTKSGLTVEKEKEYPLIYDSVRMPVAYRADIVVEDKVIVELKAISALTEYHHAQILSYLRLSGCKLGYLINFHEPYYKNAVHRKVNGL
jgi:GxxExxY protein